MKHAAWLLLLPVLMVLVVGYRADFSGEDARAVAAPPLSLEGYLDEKLPEAAGDKPKMKVDNHACYVCHGNYEDEKLVVTHGTKGVGCIDCHGKSFAHRGDEDNITPPEKMYPPEEIDKTCAGCHKTHDVTAAKVIARWQQRCSAKTDPKTIVCTDCHGRHRLRLRTVRWDKRTGKLIIRKKGERINVAPDLTKKKPEQQPDEPAPPDPQRR